MEAKNTYWPIYQKLEYELLNSRNYIYFECTEINGYRESRKNHQSFRRKYRIYGFTDKNMDRN